MLCKDILLFADRLPPLIGGMEMHGAYFIKYFSNCQTFKLLETITKNKQGFDCLLSDQEKNPIKLDTLPNLFNPRFIFFNSGRWIEQLTKIRGLFPKAIFVYRTGGNEILKATLIDNIIPEHHERQKYWVQIINNTINLLITNSYYTESRLHNIGIKCAMERCVGGVNIEALSVPRKYINKGEALSIFCAARFVPYKNHALLIQVIKELILKGKQLKLGLAGEGPLLDNIKKQVLENNISEFVEFLGAIDNETTCKEIAAADIYMQLSADYLTEVPGGSYIHSEGMGRSILEAITADTFVIAGNSGAFPEIISPDRGLLVELGNPKEIADDIAKILNCFPKKRKITEHYSWQNLFKRYEEIFQSL